MRERPEHFPGVGVSSSTCASTRTASSAAQLFGTISEITEDQLKDEALRGIDAGHAIGQSGLEDEYDKYLRGIDGYSRVVVDAFGRATSSAGVR